MKRHRMNFTALFIVAFTMILCSCGTNSSMGNGEDTVKKTLQGPTKEINIDGTIYTIKENWSVVEKADTETWIYFQETVPKEIHNIIMVSTYENLSKEVASSGLGTRSLIRDKIIPDFKQSLRKAAIVQDDYVEDYFVLPETPVLHLRGQMNINQHDIYLFMNDYTHITMVQYYHNADEDYSDDVRTIIENLKFSYDGFLEDKENTLHASSIGSSSDKNSCDGEPYGTGSDWAKYDDNKDGCINDAEFQIGMGAYIEEQANSSTKKKSCDGEPYGVDSDWAKYDKNGDGCINDSEFQKSLSDHIDKDNNN